MAIQPNKADRYPSLLNSEGDSLKENKTMSGAFKNSPRIVTIKGERMMEVYRHQPLTFDHFDVHCQIKADGKIQLTKAVKGSDEYDEIEISASLVFKLVGLLKDTRSVEFVAVDDANRLIKGDDSKPLTAEPVAPVKE